MFNWLGNLFPYSDLHSLNLDWILTKMKETAAQAAKAIADSATALAQVIEAKTAAQNAQTAAQNAQTAANDAQTAADNAASSAGNAVNVAQAAQSAAQAAQSTAQAAQSTAQTAQSAAETAQSTAETAKTNADMALAKFPIQNADIASDAITDEKIANKTITGSSIADHTITKDKFKSVQMDVFDPTYSDFHFNLTIAQLNAGTTPMRATSSTFTRNTLAIVLSGNYTAPGDSKTHYLSLRSGVFTRPQSSSYVEIDVKLTDMYAPDMYAPDSAETIRSYSGKFIIKTVGTNYKLWFTFNNTIDAEDISTATLSGYIRYLSAV